MNQYIYGVFNVAQIAKEKSNISFHQLFIFGYDKSKQEFDVADFIFENKYSSTKISFESIRKAFIQVCDKDDWLTYSGGILLISYYDKGKELYHDLNISWIIQSLRGFIKSENSMIHNGGRFYPKQPMFDTFGMNIYDELINLLKSDVSDESYWDLRTGYGIYSHKKIMGDRMSNLADNGYKINDLYNNYQSVINLSKIIVNLSIKANMDKNNRKLKYVQKISSLLYKMKKQETSIYEELIYEFTKSYNFNN